MRDRSQRRLLCLGWIMAMALLVFIPGARAVTSISIDWEQIKDNTDQVGDFGTAFVGDGTEYTCTVTGIANAQYKWSVSPTGGYCSVTLNQKISNNQMNWQSPPNGGNFNVTVIVYPQGGGGGPPQTYDAKWKATLQLPVIDVYWTDPDEEQFIPLSTDEQASTKDILSTIVFVQGGDKTNLGQGKVRWKINNANVGTFDSGQVEEDTNIAAGVATNTFKASLTTTGTTTIDGKVKVKIKQGSPEYQVTSPEVKDVSNDINIVKVEKLQYYDFQSSQWVDITGTLYVAKDEFVQFKAIPDPSGASWPNGKPVWGGTSGASGSGETKSVTFNTLSSSSTDYKTVTAECGNTVIVNVVVFDFTGELTPDDNFSGRSQSNYGIAETVDLDCTITPSGVTAAQAGGLRWKITTGVGTLSNITDNGTADYDAGASAGNVTLYLEVKSGPSEGAFKFYDRTIVAPSSADFIQKPGTGIWHEQGYGSVGFKGWVYLLPKNVSFKNIKFSEGTCPAIKTGFYIGKNPNDHPQGSWLSVGGGNISTGSRVLGTDTVAQQYSGPFSDGTFTWNIPWKYRVGTTGDGTSFTTATHYQTMSSTGTATIQKHGVGPFSKALNDPDSSY